MRHLQSSGIMEQFHHHCRTLSHVVAMSDADDQSIDRLHREAALYREDFQKRGVIYMSRVPPFMKPNKAKSMFEQYGEITRLYLAEEGFKPFKCLNIIVD